MLLEIFGFCILAIFAIVVYAETGKRQELGVIGALLLAILSLTVYSDGVQIMTSQTVNTTSIFNATNNETISVMNVTPAYTSITVPTINFIGGFNGAFGLVGVLFAIFMLFYYAFRILK